MPFYVSPEQVMKDRADYARKGIARGRSLVALRVRGRRRHRRREPVPHALQDQRDLRPHRVRGVGKYNEFQMLRVAGVRHADLKGYSYSREDVTRQGARQRVRADARPGVHPRDEAVRGRAPRRRGRARRRRPRRDVPHPLRRHRHGRAGLHGARRSGRADHRGARGAVRRRTWSSATRVKLGAQVLGGRRRRRSPPTSSRSRCSTAPAPGARSAASRATSSTPSSTAS